MPMIMRTLPPSRSAAAIHRRTHRPGRLRRGPTKIASPIRKCPILSSTISGSAAIASAVSKLRPCPAWTSRPSLRAQARRRRRCAAIRPPPLPSGRRPVHRTRRRCEFRSPAHRTAAAASICRGSAAMNSDTRMPASPQLRNPRNQRCALAGNVEPAFGGALLAPFRHQAGGMRPGLAARSATISSVAAISKFSGLSISALSRAMSSSRMWRRSSRRCAVMPSAPASIASFAARTGSGCTPPRALRMVAT